MKTFNLNILLILFFVALVSCQEEDPVDDTLERLDNFILGEYEGGLEIFYEDDPLYMEKIKLKVNRIDNYYTLLLDSKIKLNVESINLNIISIDHFVDEYCTVYVDVIENQLYKTKEVGAYKNVIYLNRDEFDSSVRPNAEMRLSLISLEFTI